MRREPSRKTSSLTPLQEEGAPAAETPDRLRSPCGPDPGPARNPYRRYLLEGPQADPEAAYWTQGTKTLPRTATIHSMLLLTSDPANTAFYIPPYPKTADYLEWEIAELVHLQALRDDPAALAGGFDRPAPPNSLPDDFLDTMRLPLSGFIQLDPPPFGAVFHAEAPGRTMVDNVNVQHLRLWSGDIGPKPALVSTGRHLARMFENETPGLIHRGALNYLFYRRREISAPRQARVWMAMDLAIYTGLVAAWYYKWAADPTGYGYRQRPFEFDHGANLTVLFDRAGDDAGASDLCARSAPCPSPGTPRAPAYPSAHSTAASAASAVIAYFFPEEREQLEMLADNIGMSQLWAGVHWRSDHAAGLRLGRAAAKRIIEQLESECVPAFDDPEYSQPDCRVPDHGALRKRALERRNANHCKEGQGTDVLKGQRRDPFEECGPA